MKKVLLGTTGMIAAAAIAGGAVMTAPTPSYAQDISVGGLLDVRITGRHDFSYRYFDSDLSANRNSQFWNDFRIELNADGVGDATGIRYGYRSRFRTDSSQADAGDVVFDRNWAFFQGGFGEFRGGQLLPVTDLLRISGSSFTAKGTGGIDGLSANAPRVRVQDSGIGGKIMYLTPNIMGFQAGVDYASQDSDVGRAVGAQPAGNSHNDSWSAGANWQGSFGALDLGVYAGFAGSAGSPGLEGRRNYQVGGRVGFAGFDVDVGYGEERSSSNTAGRVNFINAGIGTELGGTGLGFTFQNDNIKFGNATQYYYLSATQPVLPGVSLRGDLGYVDGDEDGVDLILQVRTVF